MLIGCEKHLLVKVGKGKVCSCIMYVLVVMEITLAFFVLFLNISDVKCMIADLSSYLFFFFFLFFGIPFGSCSCLCSFPFLHLSLFQFLGSFVEQGQGA